MNKRFLVLLVNMLLGAHLSAFAFEFTTVDADVGYSWRVDDIKWLRKDNPQNPNLASFYHYDNLQIHQLNARIELITCNNIYFKAKGSFGGIYKGDGTLDEKNYSFPGQQFNPSIASQRTRESLFSDARDGSVWDMKVALGYVFHFCCNTLRVIPDIGYSVHNQQVGSNNFNIDKDNGAAIVDAQGRSLFKPVPGYKQHFESRWKGMFVGVDGEFDVTCHWQLFGGFEWHFASYRGEWEQNSFTSVAVPPLVFSAVANDASIEAYGHGLMGNFGFKADVACNWYVTLYGDYAYWWADGTLDRNLTGVNVDNIWEYKTVWKSWSVTGGVGYSF
jgi:hypothetical protein